MNLRTTVILAILAAIAGLCILLTELYKKPVADPGAALINGTRLFEVKTEDIEKVEIAANGTSITCEKKGREWWITSPMELRADEIEMRTLASRFEFAAVRGSIPEQEIKNAAEYGLDEPRLTATARTGNNYYTVTIGSETFLKDGVYAQASGHKDFLKIDHDVFDVFNTSIAKLRDKHIFKYEPSNAEALMLEYMGTVLSFIKTNGRWIMESPVKDNADTKKVEDVLDRGVDLKAVEFVEDNCKDAGKYGLDRPERRMSIKRSGQTEFQELRLGSHFENGKKQYACTTDSATVFAVNTEDYREIFNSVYEFRSKKIFPSNTQDITEIKIYQAGQLSVDVSKIQGDDRKFYIIAPQATATEYGNTEAFIKKLAGYEIQNFMSDDQLEAPKYGLDPAPLRLELFTKTGDLKPAFIYHLAKTDKCTFIREENNPRIAAVNKELAEMLERGLYLFRTRVVYYLEQNFSTVTYIGIFRPDTKTELISENGKWFFSDNKDMPVNEFAVKTIITTPVNFLMVDDFVLRAGKTDADFGFDAPQCSLSYKAVEKGTEVQRTLIIGKNIDEKQVYARLAETEDVFLLPDYMRENILTADFRQNR